MTSLVGVGSCLHVYHIGTSSFSQVKHGEIREDLKGIVLSICKASKAFIYVISICMYYIKHQGEYHSYFCCAPELSNYPSLV